MAGNQHNCEVFTPSSMAQCAKCGHNLPGEDVCMCSCENCANIVFNPVLAYCQYSLENYSVVEVTKAVEQFFCNEDVAAAREVLRRMFLDRLDDLEIKKIANRKSSTNRTCLEANASDVTEAVYQLINSITPVRFATFELKKLPLLTATLAATRTQAEVVLMMEKKIHQMEQRLVEHDNQLKQHDDQFARISQTEGSVSTVGLPAAANMHQTFRAGARPKTQQPTMYATEMSLPLPGEGFGASAKRLVTDAAKMSLPPPGEGFGASAMRLATSWADVTARPPQGTDGPIEDQKWEKQRSERLRLLKESQNKMSKKRTPRTYLQGTATNTEIKAGKGPNRDLWIFNVDKDMTDEALRSYIAAGGSGKQKQINIRLFEPRYRLGAESKQFRLTIGINDFDYVYNSEFWPLDVSIRRYWLSEEEKGKIADKRKADKKGADKKDAEEDATKLLNAAANAGQVTS